MSDQNHSPSRRDMLAAAGHVTFCGAAAPAMASSILLAAAPATLPRKEAAEARSETLARKVADALEEAYGLHPGLRRNHTKGIGALGTFVGNPDAAAYSRSALFSGKTLDVIARFSVAGGDPDASDAERSARGMALEFRLPDGNVHHMTMIHTPMFFAAMPQTFLDKFVALTIDPATGKPDPAKLKAFAASHADTAGQAQFLATHNPPPSYANCAFFGIHAFKFIDAHDKVTLIKFRFVPQDGEKQLSDAELKSAPRDFLEPALVQRTKQGPVKWDMILTIGQPGDPETNPTLLWPTDRKELKAGTLTITSTTPATGVGSNQINYDPLVMADGIAATQDPVLLFRSPSYAISHSRRLQGL